MNALFGRSESGEAYKQCRTCGLTYAPTLSHGVVDCFAEFKRQIHSLAVQRNDAKARAEVAEEQLAAVRKALHD